MPHAFKTLITVARLTPISSQMNTAIGDLDSIETFFEIELSEDGERISTVNTPIRVLAAVFDTSGAVTLPLLEKIGRDSVGINYDTANVVYYSGDTAVEDLPKVVDKLVHVHLKESKGGKGVWNFGEIGTGDVDFASVLRILQDAGYDGPYSVEIEFGGEPWPPLPEVNAAMRGSREELNRLGLG